MSYCGICDGLTMKCYDCLDSEVDALRERVAQLEKENAAFVDRVAQVQASWIRAEDMWRERQVTAETQRADETVEAIAAWLESVGAPHWIKRSFGHGDWRK